MCPPNTCPTTDRNLASCDHSPRQCWNPFFLPTEEDEEEQKKRKIRRRSKRKGSQFVCGLRNDRSRQNFSFVNSSSIHDVIKTGFFFHGSYWLEVELEGKFFVCLVVVVVVFLL